MKSWWHLRHPDLVGQIQEDLRGSQPRLHLFIHDGGNAAVRGTFCVCSPVGIILDKYRISIELPPDYPSALPVVREIDGRIPRDIDFHMQSDGVACVLLPDDRGRCFPEDAPFSTYLNGPLHDFFLGQSLVALGGDWPFGEWSHGSTGVWEYYQELLQTEDRVVVQAFLEALGKPVFKGHLPCPCGSGKKNRECCRNRISELRRMIPPAIARTAFERLGIPQTRKRRFRGR